MRPIFVLLLAACATDPEPDGDEPPVEESDTVDTEPAGCRRVPDEGRCEDNTLFLCIDGEVERTECGLDRCGLDGDVYACIPSEISENPEPSDASEMLRLLTGTGRSNAEAGVRFNIPVEDATSLLFHAQVPDGYVVWVEKLREPDDFSRSLDNPLLTMAVYPGPDATLAWPSREEDGPLTEGTWAVELRTGVLEGGELYYAPEIPVSVSVHLKTDDDPEVGQLRIGLVYAGMDAPAADDRLGQFIRLAVEGWREIYGRHGLELIVTEYGASGIDSVQPGPGGGDDIYAQLSNDRLFDETDILVLMVEDFAAGMSPDIIGQAGAIPGTTGPGPRAGIAVSWLRHQGTDGEADAYEVSLLATTLAHEVGHYAGLFHPVEFDWTTFDPLSDTPTCGGENSCLRELGDNLMFPMAVCMEAGCEDDVTISADQVGVLHLYPGTL